jgi:hypothetical protein
MYTGIGNHAQIVEVECQREYEGKGAHPNFIAQGVIDGFPEVHGAPMGLKQKMSETDLIRGVWCAQRKRALSLSLSLYIYIYIYIYIGLLFNAPII